MTFDFKKEYKEFYLPKGMPGIIDVPAANYLAVRGTGNPNTEDGDYQKAVGMLYTVAYTLKMSARAGHVIDGFFDYVVPPLEGFWHQEGVNGIDYLRKEDFRWISMIRLPAFITAQEVEWAKETAKEKKKTDCSKVEMLTVTEGLCVQCMHTGPFDDEPVTVALMDEYLKQNGYENDLSERRQHHEIYLSDARKTAPDKMRTVIRHPVRKL